MPGFEGQIAHLLREALARAGVRAIEPTLRRIAPPREWGFTTTVAQELAAQELAPEATRLEAELGKKAAKQALKERTAELAAGFAERIADAAGSGLPPVVARVEAEGGYVNVYLDAGASARAVLAEIIGAEEDYGGGEPKAERVMVEFSQPNTHKEFHVGHLRNVLLGNALANIYEFGGFEVIRANYYGDHGIHVAKTLWGMTHPELLEKAEELLGLSGEMSVYARTERLLTGKNGGEEAAAIREQAEREVREILRDLGDPSTRMHQLWRQTREEDLAEFHRIYERLGVRFDVEFFESEVERRGDAIVDDLLAHGIAAVETEGEYAGAVVIDFERFDTPELWKMVIRRSDGTTLYQTKELALAKMKFEEYGVDRSLYVVGSEQLLYFAQIFKILELWGFEEARKCRHITYELVQLAGGKMSSREGTVIPFARFREEAEAQALALARERGLSADPEGVARQVAEGAVKYAFLRVDSGKTIIFDWAQALSFDGNSGPYLQYAYARSNKLLVGFAPDAVRLAAQEVAPEKEEAELCRVLEQYPDRVAQALELNAPNVIANYMYDLTRAFTDFYQECPVLKAAEDTRFFRQSLTHGFNTVLSSGAKLLGIPLPQEM
jgi:arginyl-tRNA synthetase